MSAAALAAAERRLIVANERADELRAEIDRLRAQVERDRPVIEAARAWVAAAEGAVIFYDDQDAAFAAGALDDAVAALDSEVQP